MPRQTGDDNKRLTRAAPPAVASTGGEYVRAPPPITLDQVHRMRRVRLRLGDRYRGGQSNIIACRAQKSSARKVHGAPFPRELPPNDHATRRSAPYQA